MVEMASIGELAPFSVDPKTEMARWLTWPPELNFSFLKRKLYFCLHFAECAYIVEFSHIAEIIFEKFSAILKPILKIYIGLLRPIIFLQVV